MENATDGLIMAGSVLIGVIIISLFVYMFSNMGEIAKDFQEEIDATVVQKFNEPFEKYIGREDLTPHDLLTVYNLAKQVNSEAGSTIIELDGIPSVKDISVFLSSEDKYKCLLDKVQYNKETKKISYLKFEKAS